MSAIRFAWKFIDEHMSMDDNSEFDSAVDFFVRASQAVAQLLQPGDLSYKKVLEEVLGNPSKRKKVGNDGADNPYASLLAAVSKIAALLGEQE